MTNGDPANPAAQAQNLGDEELDDDEIRAALKEAAQSQAERGQSFHDDEEKEDPRIAELLKHTPRQNESDKADKEEVDETAFMSTAEVREEVRQLKEELKDKNDEIYRLKISLGTRNQSLVRQRNLFFRELQVLKEKLFQKELLGDGYEAEPVTLFDPVSLTEETASEDPEVTRMLAVYQQKFEKEKKQIVKKVRDEYNKRLQKIQEETLKTNQRWKEKVEEEARYHTVQIETLKRQLEELTLNETSSAETKAKFDKYQAEEMLREERRRLEEEAKIKKLQDEHEAAMKEANRKVQDVLTALRTEREENVKILEILGDQIKMLEEKTSETDDATQKKFEAVKVENFKINKKMNQMGMVNEDLVNKLAAMTELNEALTTRCDEFRQKLTAAKESIE
eukprot:GFYU01011248.1.p1 GENE.GFYU01011248.1~~GFYU01011248.1.p1  ORF type:complete len:395 (-),score=127.31 GFYU01011248.1:153-1337(-)